MNLDPTVCYRALLSRDRRFDGRFFTGVLSTGVYCRPVCPARTPRRENVQFFACAAAAEEAGFRPCKRCLPYSAAATPSSPDLPDVVARALASIADGALDDAGVDALAARVAIGPRQLRRLFEQHLGASPLSVAKVRRVHFARSLLDDTGLSVAQIAFAAGFRSIRQFNHDMRATFGTTPTEMRAGRRPPASARGLGIRLAYRPPLDWAGAAGFFAARAIPGVEAVEPGRYARTVQVDGAAGVVEITPADGHLRLDAQLPAYDSLIGVVEKARRIFDLAADPATVARHLSLDPMLAPLVRARPGLRLPGSYDGFETAVRAVLGQQISVRAATTLSGRLVDAYGKPVEGYEDRGLTHLFPTPETLAEADLASVGTTGAQATAIRALARATLDGLTLEPGRPLDDLVADLCALPGVGPWTAHYLAMRACGEPDAFPAADLGLARATGLSPRQLAARAERWRPWRAYAAVYLWTKG